MYQMSSNTTIILQDIALSKLSSITTNILHRPTPTENIIS